MLTTAIIQHIINTVANNCTTYTKELKNNNVKLKRTEHSKLKALYAYEALRNDMTILAMHKYATSGGTELGRHVMGVINSTGKMFVYEEGSSSASSFYTEQ